MTRPSQRFPVLRGRSAARCGALRLAAALFAAALVAPLSGLGAAPVAAAVVCGPAAAGRAAVGVVVDTGTGTPLVRCVDVREGASGREVLQAAGVAVRVGSGTPADANQGAAFVCGLLGVPAAGCATPGAGGFDYWAYYRQRSGSPWTYSRVGFFSPVGSRCAVEGWRYVRGGGVAASANPRPRVDPPEVRCPGDPVPTTTRPPAPTTVPRPATPTTTAPAPRSTARAGTAAPIPPAVAGAPAPAAPSPTGPPGSPSAVGPPAAGPSATGPSVAGPSGVRPPSVAGVTTVAPGEGGAPPTSGGARTGVDETAAGSASTGSASTGSASTGSASAGASDRGSPWALVAGGAVALVLAAGALVRSRRHREVLGR